MAIRTRFWAELRWPEFRDLPDSTLAVLPVGAIEQHGPHLPVAVDACLVDAVVGRAVELLPAETPVLVLPTTAVGKSNEHVDFPGTLTLSAETLGRVWYEIGASVRRAGLRKLLLLNGHGGQPQVAQIVVRELRIDHDMLAVAANWFSWGLPDGLFEPAEVRHGIHAGAVETSMMLAVRPDLVAMARAADFAPVTVADDLDYPRLRALGAAGLGWKTQDLHGAGACGDATGATAEAGRAVIEHAARHLAELLQELVRFPLQRLRARGD